MASVDIDQTESAELLRRYAQDEGFDWRQALAPKELLVPLADTFGTGVLFPPSDTTLFIDVRGTPHAVSGTKDERTFRDLVAQYRR